jgi:hypothetical protein
VNWLVDNSSKTIAFGIRGQADLSSSRCRRSSTYIGGDDSLATAWRDHDNPLNTFRDVWSLTRGELIKLGTPTADVDRRCVEEYRV